MVVGYTNTWAVQRGRPRGGLVSGTPTCWSIAQLNSTFVAEPLCCGSMAAKISALARHNLRRECCSIQKSLHKMHKGKDSEMPPHSVAASEIFPCSTATPCRAIVSWISLEHYFLVGICFTTASPHIHFLTSHRNKNVWCKEFRRASSFDSECDISRDMQMVCNVERGSWLFPHL